MKRTRYDQQHAHLLVPLLKAITTEILERNQSIAVLENAFETGTKGLKRKAAAARLAEIDANLALHRRELRLATRELERLGCALDQDHPLRVLIPGQDGELESGYAWTPLDEQMQSTAT